MNKEFFILIRINDGENIYQLQTSKGKSYLFKDVVSTERFMCKKYPQLTGSIRALLLNFQNIFWNVVSRELHYSKDFNIKNVNDVKNWKQIHSTGNQTKDYIKIMKSFNLDYSNEEIDIKQDFLENLKNLQSILK